MINTPMPLAAPVNAALDGRGWTARPLTLVQTAPLPALVGDVAPRRDLPPVELADSPADAWYEMVAEHKGTLPHGREEAAHRRTGGGLRVRAGRGRRPARGRPRRGHRPGPLARRLPGADRARRPPHGPGLGTWCARWLSWATQRGAARAYLQVEERNTPATTLYQGLGFRTHHTYLTREAPD
nr:hypothetical protein GCM10020092_012540 [Actinoplanes digitatis]